MAERLQARAAGSADADDPENVGDLVRGWKQNKSLMSLRSLVLIPQNKKNECF